MIYSDVHFETTQRLLHPETFVDDDIKAVYQRGEVFVGWPDGIDRVFEYLQRKNTVAIIGAQLGDEGKGRVVDNKIAHLLKMGARQVYVVRFQGGANAGHTIGLENGGSIALHQVPSGILYEQAVGVMDKGMVVHMEDLQTEIEEAERVEQVGDLRGKLILDPEAMLATDLDRAQEILNTNLSEGKSKGGTGRGMSPVAGDRLTRRGLMVGDLLADNWEERLGKAYDIHEREFQSHGLSLTESLVPDLKETNKEKRPMTRQVGTKQEFIARLEAVRKWFLDRDEGLEPNKKMIQNTFTIYQENFTDLDKGFLFEGAQAVGLDPNFGRIPDVTSTNTTIDGIAIGTRFPLWNERTIQHKIGVMKLTYMSSVGSARMITDAALPRERMSDAQINAIEDQNQRFAAMARRDANEFGATTGRPRDICFLDLPLLRFNAAAGKIEMLAGTHLDIAEEGQTIRVCTHYTDLEGKPVAYQPGIEHQKGLTPQYVDLPGWDGKKARQANNFNELPDNAKKFLAFLQRSIGRPIVFLTTGPARENAIELRGMEKGIVEV